MRSIPGGHRESPGCKYWRDRGAQSAKKLGALATNKKNPRLNLGIPKGSLQESTFRLFVGEAATVVVRGVDPRTGRKLTLVPPSRLGAKKIGTAASTLKATTDRARVFRTKLRFRGLVREKLYRITVQATDRDGQRSTLSIPLRG